MRSIILVKITVYVTLLCICIIESKRANYRKDYRFEKAFNTFYKLHQTAMPWYQARIRCEAEGTELIIPETLDEADSMVLVMTPILTKFEGVFIGIHDLYSERSFVTIKGDSFRNSILDLLWERTEPQYNGGRCVAMRRNGKMFVHPCTDHLPFVCKIKASDIVYHTDCDTYDNRWVLGPNSTCYMTHVEHQTWHDAYSTCYSAGGYLAIIDTREETEYLRYLFKQISESFDATTSDFAFLGFSDLFQRFHYRTIFGNRLAENETDWDFKCPGNESTIIMEERCGGISRSGLLAARACDIPAMFFCEKHGNKMAANDAVTDSATDHE